MDAVDQDDRVARPEDAPREQAALVVEELDVDDAALDDEHLLEVVDLPARTDLW